MAAASRKRSRDSFTTALPALSSLNEQEYCREVLGLSDQETENAIDERLAKEATDFGISLPSQDLDKLTSSLSMATLGSDPTFQSSEKSRLSHSTAPTSCSSSENRPFTQSSYRSEAGTSPPQSPSTLSISSDKKNRLSFRGSILKMTGFKKRRSSGAPSTTSSIDGNVDSVPSSVNASRTAVYKPNRGEPPVESPISPRNQDLTLPWCQSTPLPSVTQLVYGDGLSSPITDDAEAVRRTKECKEIQSIVSKQMEERARFMEYWTRSMKQVQSQHASTKRRVQREHAARVQKMRDDNETSVDKFEQRQLQAELDLIADLEANKQACLLRLRHMEAYCNSPPLSASPDSSSKSTYGPRDSTTSAGSFEAIKYNPFPRHEVTDRDYNTLATQYRERDAMDGLHQSKIEVLRGKQEKQLRDFVAKKENEVKTAMTVNEEARQELDKASKKALDALAQALDEKRCRLQTRWVIERSIAVAKMESKTGQAYAALNEMEIEPLQPA